jgi:hypothetical protein
VKEADELLDEFAHEAENNIVASYDTKSGSYQPLIFPDVPMFLPLAISDAVHNLRSALDYLVFELARKDSGRVQNGTQFPIETYKLHTTPDGNKIGFDMVVNRYLRGVNQVHRDAIEAMQPYKGVEWTETLRDISNPDKHRQLTTISKEKFIGGTTSSREGHGVALPTGNYIRVDPHQTVLIELPKGKTWVMHTLYKLEAHVHATISAFNSEF